MFPPALALLASIFLPATPTVASQDPAAPALELVGTLEGHADPVYSVAWTADGSRIVTGGFDHTVRVWDAGSLVEEASPELDESASKALEQVVGSLGFFPGFRIVGDASKPVLPKVFDSHESLVLAVAPSPDSRRVLSASLDKTIRLFDLIGDDPPVTFSGHGEQVYDVAWSPDGTHAASASADQTVRIWNVADATQERAIEPAHEKVAYAVAYSPAGDLIASGGADKLVKLWNPADGAEVRKLEGHGGEVYCVAFRPGDGSVLASAGVDKTIKLWNPADGSEVRTLSGHPDVVYGISWSPDGTRIASIGYAGNLSIWEVESGTLVLRQLVNGPTPCYDVAWGPDGRIAVAASDQKVYVFKLP